MNAIKQYRLERNMSQKDFADKIGWSVVALNRVEKGKIIPGDSLIARLASALGLSISDAFSLAGSHDDHPLSTSSQATECVTRKEMSEICFFCGTRETDEVCPRCERPYCPICSQGQICRLCQDEIEIEEACK